MSMCLCVCLIHPPLLVGGKDVPITYLKTTEKKTYDYYLIYAPRLFGDSYSEKCWKIGMLPNCSPCQIDNEILLCVVFSSFSYVCIILTPLNQKGPL